MKQYCTLRGSKAIENILRYFMAGHQGEGFHLIPSRLTAEHNPGAVPECRSELVSAKLPLTGCLVIKRQLRGLCCLVLVFRVEPRSLTSARDRRARSREKSNGRTTPQRRAFPIPAQNHALTRMLSAPVKPQNESPKQIPGVMIQETPRMQVR